MPIYVDFLLLALAVMIVHLTRKYMPDDDLPPPPRKNEHRCVI